ncbi:hypothetical protein [Nostoc sp. LPT]|uniref:hypothetical protein n=1 Tax=Nostoc sp. LPT TaxID=2815387 RepID=UPI001D82953A|nr:hypothetical protein [Nostoc sp. LPT]MBN4006330.1 hypothetical protein [Nostoc sp. LPT]
MLSSYIEFGQSLIEFGQPPRIYIKKMAGGVRRSERKRPVVSLKKRLLLDIVDAGSWSNVPGSCVFAIAIMNVFCHNWNQVGKNLC